MAEHRDGAGAIGDERRRQMSQENFDAKHDDAHAGGELALAAACYAAPVQLYEKLGGESTVVTFRDPWPWAEGWDKRTPFGAKFGSVKALRMRQRELEKAGALLAAEWDRLERMAEDSTRWCDGFSGAICTKEVVPLP